MISPNNFLSQYKNWVLLFAMLFYGLQVNAQNNTHTVDFSAYSPDYTWSSKTLARNSQCCCTPLNHNCIHFYLPLSSNTAVQIFPSIGNGSQYQIYTNGGSTFGSFGQYSFS